MTATATKKAKALPITKQPEPAIVLGVVPKGELLEIRLDAIKDPPGTADRIEREGDAERIQETARSLREVGQLQPIMVEVGLKIGEYIRVFGRRRLAAARINHKDFGGKDAILAIVVPPLEPDIRRTIVAVENVQRQNLTPAEEHLAVFELLELQAWAAARQVDVTMPIGRNLGKRVSPEIEADHAKDSEGNQRGCREALLAIPKVRARACELVASMLAKPDVWVRDRMYIGRLGAKGRALVLSEKLPLSHAREIAKVADPEIREDLAISFAAGGDESGSDTEAGLLEDLQDEVRSRLFNLKVVPWRLDVPVGKLPACDGCPHNSASNPGLFDHGGQISDTMIGGVGRHDWRANRAAPTDLAGSVCTNHTCYGQKLRITKPAASAAAKRIVDGGRKPAEAKVPPFVDPKFLDKKVRDRRALKGSKAGRSASKSPAKVEASQAQRDRRYAAKNSYDKALETWCNPAKKKLRELCKKDQVLGLALSLLFIQEIAVDTQDDINYEGVFKRAKRVLSPKECEALVARAVPMKALAQFEDLVRKTSDSEIYLDGPDYGIEDCRGVFEAVCSTLGIELKGPRPEFADFLKPTDAKPAVVKPAKPAKGKKSKATASTDEEVDDAE